MSQPTPDSRHVHRSTLAGTWYPARSEELRALVDDALDEAMRSATVSAARAGAARVRGLVLPHAGLRWSGSIAARGCALLEGAPVTRVVVLGTAHRLRFHGLALHRVGAYETPLGRARVDTDAIDTLLAQPDFDVVEAAHDGEHSIEIEIPFLQSVSIAGELRLVPALVSELDEAALLRAAAAIGSIVDDETVIIASSDLTHFGDAFGFLPFEVDERVAERLRRLDMGVVEPIVAVDRPAFENYCAATGITVCGVQPIRLLLEIMRRRQPAVEGTLLGYTTSAALSDHDYAHSVSYAAIAFVDRDVNRLTAAECDMLLELARRTLESAAADPQHFDTASIRLPEDAIFQEPRAVFVTLRSGGELRGCIGTTVATRPLAAAVVSSAWAAAFEDPRFAPLEPAEVLGLQIEISVLTPLEPVSRPEEIVVGRDGVLVEFAGRRGVFLPQVAGEQGWNRRKFLERLAVKAGLEPSAWIPGATYRRFQVQTMEERVEEGVEERVEEGVQDDLAADLEADLEDDVEDDLEG